MARLGSLVALFGGTKRFVKKDYLTDMNSSSFINLTDVHGQLIAVDIGKCGCSGF